MVNYPIRGLYIKDSQLGQFGNRLRFVDSLVIEWTISRMTNKTADAMIPTMNQPATSIPAADKKTRGQFFTKNPTVHNVMLGLVSHRTGLALEPSAGAGDLVALLEKGRPGLAIKAVELDGRIERSCATEIEITDFFTFCNGKERSFDVIFGNPPYVAWKDVEDSTVASIGPRKERYSDKTNLYHLFIDASLDLLKKNGEVIFIVPKEWLYTTSAAPLRAKMSALGAVTHIVDCGEEKLFADADIPALLIFRWVRGRKQTSTKFASSLDAARKKKWVDRYLVSKKDRWMLLDSEHVAAVRDWGTLGDSFNVRVGLVTGMDKVFRLAEASLVEPECVQYQVDTTRKLVPFLNVNHVEEWDQMPAKAAAYLTSHKEELIGRRISTFTDGNWWKYGAIRNNEHMESKTPRFFSLCKTRSSTPFFKVPKAKYFTGGVLGIFKKSGSKISVDSAIKLLNDPKYRPVLEAMFLTSEDKVSLQPSTLMDSPFPVDEGQIEEFINPRK